MGSKDYKVGLKNRRFAPRLIRVLAHTPLEALNNAQILLKQLPNNSEKSQNLTQKTTKMVKNDPSKLPN